MNGQAKPWDLLPKLTQEKIEDVGQIIINVRQECLLYYRPDLGDTPWSHGCRAYEWTRKAILKASKSIDYLSISNLENLQCHFWIDEVPVRFIKDDVLNPSSRAKKQSIDEILQGSLFGYGGASLTTWRYFIEINPITQELSRLVFAGINEHPEAIAFHEINLQNRSSLFSVTDPKPENQHMGPPTVGSKKFDDAV